MCELVLNCFALDEINGSIGDDQDKKCIRMREKKLSGRLVNLRLGFFCSILQNIWLLSDLLSRVKFNVYSDIDATILSKTPSALQNLQKDTGKWRLMQGQ